MHVFEDPAYLKKGVAALSIEHVDTYTIEMIWAVLRDEVIVTRSKDTQKLNGVPE